MLSNDIRRAFLDFFVSKGHTAVPSSPLVPNDPTLMFANAGMVPFKDVFTGKEKRGYSRATSSQKCIRISGKHNDLENVGRTARHHTFFEMLGNFSFGDYFKEEAIVYAWELLTRVYDIPQDRMIFTVFGGEDDLGPDEEAKALWKKVTGLGDERVVGMGKADNFWQMGETGPCGPCSEIHFWQGPLVDGRVPYERFGQEPDADGNGWFEIWNLVFMQYERSQADGVFTLTPLPAPSIDTGAGLERVASVLQGKTSNYDTDLLQALVQKASALCGKEYGKGSREDDDSMRVIADHARLTAFCIAEGIFPDRGGREYVLRRVMRRAIRHGHRLGITKPFLHEVALEVVASMGDHYPELRERRDLIATTAEQEEVRFRATLEHGLKLLDEELTQAKGRGETVLAGAAAFKLYDTHGFPLDLTEVITQERGFSVDTEGYDKALAEAKAQSEGSKLNKDEGVTKAEHDALALVPGHAVTFTGYDDEEGEGKIVALLVGGALVDEVAWTGGEGALPEVDVVVDRTPFYGRGGGQVGDVGEIRVKDGNGRVAVHDTTKPIPGLVLHHARLSQGTLRVGDVVTLEVDHGARAATRRNHSATHLLHWALGAVLGPHVEQKGSLVGPDVLRFDFSHGKPMTQGELERVEDLVNGKILLNAPVVTEVLAIDAARKKGAKAIFGDKYGDVVRVLTMTADSVELCGGTHARALGDIGLFKIVTETGTAAGVRRIEAATGTNALALVREQEALLRQIAMATKSNAPRPRVESVTALVDRVRELEKERADLVRKLAMGGGGAGGGAGGGVDAWIAQARDVSGVKVLGVETEVADAAALRELAEKLRDKLGDAVVLVASGTGGKAQLVVAVAKSVTSRIKAGDLIRPIAQIVGGNGGGRPDMAMAGGPDVTKVKDAVAAVYEKAAAMLGAGAEATPTALGLSLGDSAAPRFPTQESSRGRRAALSGSPAALYPRARLNDGARVLLNVTELPRLADAPARQKAWIEIVRGVAALAAPDTPAPLESLDPAALAAAVLVAKEAGALDAPTPLPAELEARALYEIASALPSGPARACVGPLAERWLYKGRSDVFLSVARRIALTAPAELRGEAVRARLALSCAIPPRLGTAAEDLALALLAREESARNWIEIPSMGPLPQRRLAGRLLGRAARAHARGRGGAWAARLVAGETVAMVLARLLADREPLVWRHAAIARGLLSASDGRFWRAICDGLSPSMSPTEWRRAAASLASSAARAPDRAMALLDELLATAICDRDPGTATAVVWGIAAAAERQPEAADAMLAKLVDKAPLAVAEGLGDVLALGPGGDFGLRAFERSREALSIAHQRVTGDEGVRALLGKLLEELSPGGEPAVDGALRKALRAYRDEGADAAHALGREALTLMESHVETLEPLHGSGDDEDAASVRRRAFSVLRDIERGMLQDGTLADLLSIGVPDEAARRALVSLGAAQDRVASWVLRREQEEVAHPPGRASTPPGRRGHTALRLHQIRALLHVADAPIPGEVPGAASRIRALRKRIASLTRDKLAAHPPAALHRALCATLARALDALVRTGDLDEDDVVLVLARAELTAADARTIAEASMNPHLEAIVAAFAALLPGDGDDAPASIPATRRHPSFPAPEEVQRPLSGPAQVHVAELVDFSRRLREPSPSRAPQIVSLRSTLVSLSSSLSTLLAASSLEHVVDTGETSPPLLTLEAALTDLSRRASVADRRLGKESVALAREPELHQRVADAVDQLHAGHASMALTAADRDASQALPPAFARVVSDVLTFLQGLPLTLPGERRPRPKALPAWLPSDRIVGGFYVVAPVGEGGAGTVFQVRRLADKDDPTAERFALKMPVFQGSSATMTEAQFLQMFRDEASALLGLPHHENLARFVTFDLSARPRPILVMELVDGASLEELLVPAGLSTARALELTLGVLAGLAAMHEVGIAHLDVKPTNVILRRGEVPVLVDFGLAGRHIRPGCGSVAYGAPEVWVGGDGAKKLSPLPTDAYAAACLVFEVLGATPLFAGSEIAAIAMHVGHDGWPPALVGWRDVAALRPLAELLASALRKEPADRIGTKKLHAGLSRLAPSLRDLPWPLGPA